MRVQHACFPGRSVCLVTSCLQLFRETHVIEFRYFPDQHVNHLARPEWLIYCISPKSQTNIIQHPPDLRLFVGLFWFLAFWSSRRLAFLRIPTLSALGGSATHSNLLRPLVVRSRSKPLDGPGGCFAMSSRLQTSLVQHPEPRHAEKRPEWFFF